MDKDGFNKSDEERPFFDIPICLFTFKRTDTVGKIVAVLRMIRPKKVYLFSDGPRKAEERPAIDSARRTIMSLFDWPCEIIPLFQSKNQGIYKQIGLGAIEVLKKEGTAIFLEDDNLPEPSFFPFCKEMLARYADDPKILWICGTNYLGDYKTSNEESYVFTKQLLPCGWASWYNKFKEDYDGDFSYLENPKNKKILKTKYAEDRFLYKQQLRCFEEERYRMKTDGKYASWDYQMALSIREHDCFGVCPKKNQIKNIGVDSNASHGGTKYDLMTRRFCLMDSFPLSFPLIHPKKVTLDPIFEKKIAHLRKVPWYLSFPKTVKYFVRRKIFHLPDSKAFWPWHRKK
jgi:hypothetical protein